MSAEKEIVNYWYNKKGLFTVNNIKTHNNRDCGILALKFDNGHVNSIFHIEVSCSITNNISETANPEKSVGKIVDEKFDDKSVQSSVSKYIRQFSIPENNVKKIIILGAVPKSRKLDIIKKFNEREVEVILFEDILYDVMEQLDTQYYKNDIIRTLQLTKFLLLNEPTKLAKLLANDNFTSNSRKEFLSSILGNEDIVKDFRRTNPERLSIILKNSYIKPTELAAVLNSNILNNRTRGIFMNSLLEQEKTRKIVNRTKRVRKLNVQLGKFL
ncbi:MAG TPA: hypothetical protein VJJ52_06270 [Candidatus Nanoarchaeia archaeon]|nr:hypothetical protein [Candidatus Nanoarchaeia archaeon]